MRNGLIGKQTVIDEIEAERVGRWVNLGDGNYICSECGCNPIAYVGARMKLDDYMDLLDGLCPYCRTKMEEK